MGGGFRWGLALYSDASQIALRMVSGRAGLTRAEYLGEVRERVAAALALRGELAPASDENNACRLIFSEADGLPGMVADRYNDLVVLQLLTQGTAQDDVRACADGGALVERLGAGDFGVGAAGCEGSGAGAVGCARAWAALYAWR